MLRDLGRLADMEASYATFEVTGDAKWSISKDQFTAVADKIAELTALIGDGPAPVEPVVTPLPTLASVPICGPNANR